MIEDHQHPDRALPFPPTFNTSFQHSPDLPLPPQMFIKALAVVLLIAAVSAESKTSFDDPYAEDLTITEPAATPVTQPRVQP